MNEIKLNEYGKFVDSVTSEHSKNADLWINNITELDDLMNVSLLNNGVMGLCGESGELADIVKKINWQGKIYNDELREKMKKELGDIIFYWIMCCQSLDMDPNDVVNINIEKLSARYPNGFSIERSENRTDG